MKAMVIEDFGGSERLKLKKVKTPMPADDEIQIQVAYSGVNPVDWKIREGLFKKRMPCEFPLILGWEASGIVSALGKDVKSFKVGDPVFAYCRKPIIQWGTYAEYVCIQAVNGALKPKNLTFAEAASVPLAALTAWQSLHEGAQLKEGETILIHAGAGGVGGFAIQFAKNVGATVYTTARIANHPYVMKFGADFAIDYSQQNFVEKIMEQNPQGIDLVFDCMGGDVQKASYDVLRPGGRLVSIVEKPDMALADSKRVKAGYAFVRPDGAQLSEIARLLNTGKVSIPQIEEMRLEEAAEAQEKVKAGHTRGKIVLKIA